MHSSILVALLVVGLVVAQNDVSGSPSYPSGFFLVQASATSFSYGITNLNTTTSLNSVSFTVVPSDTDKVLVSYPGGATSSSVGTISASANGYGSFTLIGQEGTYTLNFIVKYRKGLQQFSKSLSASLTVGGSMKRSEEIEFDYTPEVPYVVEGPLSKRGADVTLTPTAYSAASGVTTWFNLTVSASVAVRNLSFAVVPSDTDHVLVYYPTSGNNLGNIGAGNSKITAFAVNANPSGTRYGLTIGVQYKKGISNTWVYDSISATLDIYGAKRSIEEIDLEESVTVARLADSAEQVTVTGSSLKGDYIIGFGVGIAAIAGVAVGAAITTFAKRSTSSTTV